MRKSICMYVSCMHSCIKFTLNGKVHVFYLIFTCDVHVCIDFVCLSVCIDLHNKMTFSVNLNMKCLYVCLFVVFCFVLFGFVLI